MLEHNCTNDVHMVAVDRYLEERPAGIRRFYYAFVQTRMRVDIACFVSESI